MKNILDILTKFKKNVIYDIVDYTEYLLNQDNILTISQNNVNLDLYLSDLRSASSETLSKIKQLIESKETISESEQNFWQYLKEYYCEKNSSSLKAFTSILLDSKIPEGCYIVYDTYISKFTDFTEEQISQSQEYIDEAITEKSSSAIYKVLYSNLKKSLSTKLQENYNIASLLAENGNPKGLTYLGYFHNLEQDFYNTLISIRYLTMAANCNDLDSCFLLAEIYKTHPYLYNPQKIALYTIKGYILSEQGNKLDRPCCYFNNTCNIEDQDSLNTYKDLFLNNIEFLENEQSPYFDFIKANIKQYQNNTSDAVKIYKKLYKEYQLPEAAYNLGLIEEKKSSISSPLAAQYYEAAHSFAYPDACIKLKSINQHSHPDLSEVDFTIFSNNLRDSNLGSKLVLEKFYEEKPSLNNLRLLKQNIDHNPLNPVTSLLKFKLQLLTTYKEIKETSIESLKEYSKEKADDEKTQKERKKQFEFEGDLSDAEDLFDSEESVDETTSKQYHSGMYFYDKKIILKLILDNPLEFATLFNKYDLNKLLLEPELLILIEELSKKTELAEHNIQQYLYVILSTGYFEAGNKDKATLFLKKINPEFLKQSDNKEIETQLQIIDDKICLINNYKSNEKIKNNPAELRFLFNYFIQHNDNKSILIIRKLLDDLYQKNTKYQPIQYQHIIISSNNYINDLQDFILNNSVFFFENFFKYELDKPFIFNKIKKTILNINKYNLHNNDHDIKNKINIILSYIYIRENDFGSAQIYLERINQNDIYKKYYNQLYKLLKYNSFSKSLIYNNISWIVIKPIEEKHQLETLTSIKVEDLLDLESDYKATSKMHTESIDALAGQKKSGTKRHAHDKDDMINSVFEADNHTDNDNNSSSSSSYKLESALPDTDNDVDDIYEKKIISTITSKTNQNPKTNTTYSLLTIKDNYSQNHKTITSCLQKINSYCNNQVIQSQFLFSFRLGHQKRVIANLLSSILEHSIDVPQTHEDTLKLLYQFIENLITSHSILISGEFGKTLQTIKKILDIPSNKDYYNKVNFSKLKLDQKCYYLFGDLYAAVSSFFIKAYEFSIFFYRKAIDTLSEYHKELDDIPIINKINNILKEIQSTTNQTTPNFDINYNAGLACNNQKLFFEFFDKTNSSSSTKFKKLLEIYNKYDNNNIKVLKKIKNIYESMSEELLMDSVQNNIAFLDAILEKLEQTSLDDEIKAHNEYLYTDNTETNTLSNMLKIIKKYKDTLASDGQYFFTYRQGYQKLKICNTLYNILTDSKNTEDTLFKRLKTIAYTIERVKQGEYNYLYNSRFKSVLEQLESLALNYKDYEISEKYKYEPLMKDFSGF